MTKISADSIIRVRQIMLGLTGLACLGYAIAALVTGRPDPVAFWVPGAFGILAALVITGSFFLAGRAQGQVASDELYHAENARAQRIAYWVALGLYPLFGVLLAAGLVTFPVAFAAMGTLTGAAYLLLFVLLNARG